MRFPVFLNSVFTDLNLGKVLFILGILLIFYNYDKYYYMYLSVEWEK